ncbi:hypothetical protein E2R62_00040 [Citrobacter rodentium]|uniref:Uncharacterized protein n=1 Tax=Citrobacter rodentium TaxID=67825 RepID=A0A482PHA9_CITRO|nr:hypothetical protein E2R62_00040 [Citrobacter rodentium]
MNPWASWWRSKSCWKIRHVCCWTCSKQEYHLPRRPDKAFTPPSGEGVLPDSAMLIRPTGLKITIT